MKTKPLLRHFLLFTAALLLATPHADADDRGPDDCRIGVYRLTNGDIVDIAPADGGALRWRRFDGATGALHAGADGNWTSTLGWTERADGIAARFSCADGTLHFDGRLGRRIPLAVQETRFAARDVTLAGRLLLPPGRARAPIVVLVHGSENSSALDFYALQRLLPAVGVGAFVYDKRGTGISGGKYTQDFEVLAADAVAALREARRVAGKRAGRTGYFGTSQGGWVAPLAALREHVDFMAVGYGLAVSVIDEDRECIELEMHLAGHGAAETGKALEVAGAAHALFESNFTRGFAEFDAMRARYRDEPWYRDLHGNFTHLILGLTERQIRELAPDYDWKTPFRYDPMPTLRALDVPQLWMLGADDLDAPSAETARRLEGLIAAGHPVSIALFPGAEHGLTEFETAADGTRLSTRYSAGYFAMLRDFARDGRLHPPYGRANIRTPGAR